MNNSRNRYRLGDLGEVVTGRTPPGTEDGCFGSGIPFLTPTDMDGGRKIDAPARRLSNKGRSILDRVVVPHGVAVSCIGSQMGKSVLLTSEVATNQQINTIVPDPTIVDDVYLYYELSSRRAEIYMLGAAGSTMPILNKTGFENLVVDLPSLAEQRRIANILGSLDDKIELNRRMNETLEAMARRLFKSWFVDFDPVHAKATLRREYPKLSNADLSRRALPQMAPEIAELFSDGFEESTLGAIPSGWNAGTVPDAIEVNPTRSLAKGTVAPWLEMSNMPTRLARALAWEHREFGSGTKFINGDTLVARITPCLENGKTAFVDFLDDGQVGAGSTEYIILRPKAPLPPVFAYLLARTDDFRQHLITNMTGTSGRQRAPAESLNKFPLVTPPTKIANCFGDATENLFSQMKMIDEESLALTATRDKLLPRLLSGELGVADNGGSHEPT